MPIKSICSFLALASTVPGIHKFDIYSKKFYMFFSRNMLPPVFRQNEHIVDAMVKERVVSMAVHHDWGFVAILLEIAQGLPVDRTLHSF